MNWWYWRRKPIHSSEPSRTGTFVVEAEISRSEELRVDRLGPGEEDVEDPLPVDDPWRPVRTLGPLP